VADSAVAITAGAGTNVDTRTEGTNSNHRQVVVLGDPATNAGVAAVDATAGLKVNLGADNDVTVTALAVAAAATLANVSDTASSTTLLASNAARLAAIIYNDSTVGLYVKYGATASATSFTYFLDAGESYREERYTGVIDGIWESDASGTARVTELTAS
jgi:ornithine carbamoyltransferase